MTIFIYIFFIIVGNNTTYYIWSVNIQKFSEFRDIILLNLVSIMRGSQFFFLIPPNQIKLALHLHLQCLHPLRTLVSRAFLRLWGWPCHTGASTTYLRLLYPKPSFILYHRMWMLPSSLHDSVYAPFFMLCRFSSLQSIDPHLSCS